MAVKGLSSFERERYFCKDDPCVVPGDAEASIENGATVFFFKNIPSTMQADISDMQTSQQLNMMDGGTQTLVNRRSKKNRKAFKAGVAGWQNFPRDIVDASGNVTGQEEIPYETEKEMIEGKLVDVISERIMNMIPLALVNEVGEAAFNANTLTEAQKKKFEELSSLLGGGDTSTVATAPQNNESTEDAGAKQPEGTTGATPESTTKT